MQNSLLHIIPSNKWGGIQTYALDICRHYRSQGWDVTALTRNAVGVDARFAEHDVKLVHAPITGFFNLHSARILSRVIRDFPKDRGIIHVHRYRDAFTAVLAKKIAKRPDIRIVATRHTVRPGRDSYIFKKLYGLIDAHIFVSDMAYKAFRRARKSTISLPDNSVFILRNSLNVQDNDPKPEPVSGPIVALYQGPVVKGKGLETLIDALGQLQKLKVRLRIYGPGDPDYLDILRRRAMSRGVMEQIDWNSKATPSRELAAEAHFGVVPSIEREACGMASITFMAAGRAQVATSNGAQSEYLEQERTALLVAPADANALAEAIRRLATDPQLRTNLGQEAHAIYSRLLSWPHFIATLDKIYRK